MARHLPKWGPGRLFRFTAATLARLSDGETLGASQAASVLTIPDHAQGAAIGGGGLWIARSDWSWGPLDRLDPSTGAPQRRYEIAPGTEGIAFGSAGQLWGSVGGRVSAYLRRSLPRSVRTVFPIGLRARPLSIGVSWNIIIELDKASASTRLATGLIGQESLENSCPSDGGPRVPC
jgi:hypothetical protein